MNVKQVIIVRKSYPDGKGGFYSLRRGKEISSACHGSGMWMRERLLTGFWKRLWNFFFGLSKEEFEWLNGSFTKVTVQVDSEQELFDIHAKASKMGLKSYLVVDAGKTEFAGVKTCTCCVIGPNKSEEIDKITERLRLY